MQISVLTVEFMLSGCRSLKEKRARVRGLRERVGRLPSVAIAESDFQDVHDQSQWTLVLLAHNHANMDRLQAQIEEVLTQVDGDLFMRHVEKL